MDREFLAGSPFSPEPCGFFSYGRSEPDTIFFLKSIHVTHPKMALQRPLFKRQDITWKRCALKDFGMCADKVAQGVKIPGIQVCQPESDPWDLCKSRMVELTTHRFCLIPTLELWQPPPPLIFKRLRKSTRDKGNLLLYTVTNQGFDWMNGDGSREEADSQPEKLAWCLSSLINPGLASLNPRFLQDKIWILLMYASLCL